MSGSESSSPANKSNSPKKSKSPTKRKMEEDFESPDRQNVCISRKRLSWAQKSQTTENLLNLRTNNSKMSGSESSSPANKSNSPKKSKSPTKQKMEEDFESPESKQQKSYEDALKLQEACPELVKRAEEKYNFKLLDRNDGHLMSAKVFFVIQKEREELGLNKESDTDKSNKKSTKSEEEDDDDDEDEDDEDEEVVDVEEEEDSDHLGSGFDSGSCGSSYASEEEEQLENELTDDARSVDDPEEDGDDPFDP